MQVLQVSNLGPQTRFPVPEGILDHRGKNTVALSVWGLGDSGVEVEGLGIVAEGVVETAMKGVEMVEASTWRKRQGAY